MSSTLRLLLSAGRGPVECAWAVAELAERLEDRARREGVGVQRVDAVPGEAPGTYRSLLLRLEGPPSFAAAWTGTLCWQAPSPYRAGVARKNWYVIAEPQPDDVHPSVFSEDDVTFVATRTGGPGGQHRNKASTAIRATHRPSGTVVVVDTERRLSDNRRIAVDLLRRRIQEADTATGRAAGTTRWRTHDRIVRGAPTRTERPQGATGMPPPA
ncbi:peptide chain release factor H [Kineosporia mesophila]|uniref:Peptide chain release factor H n=1 Tax=Kineosporia mesophila TaxID=566012 RepID=A0ABP6ZE69_9ACTN|nr:peptide chain release factor H [Kineosporia mesophila]MCD5352079.1 peptide chain release factor H [Kineosporia mesophila]